MVESLLFMGAGAGKKKARSRSTTDWLRNAGQLSPCSLWNNTVILLLLLVQESPRHEAYPHYRGRGGKGYRSHHSGGAHTSQHESQDPEDLL